MRLSRRTLLALACAFGLLEVLVYLYDREHGPIRIYGNDEASIVQVIHSIEGYKDKAVELIEVKDLGERRYAAFLSNSNPGYIQFRQNHKGNYE